MLILLQIAGGAPRRPEAKGVVPHEPLRRPASNHSGRVTITLIDRKKSIFRISNDSAKTIHLATLDMPIPGKGRRFNAINVQYEVLRNGIWKRLQYTVDGFAWDFPLRPHKALVTYIELDRFGPNDFGIDLSNAEIGNISKGDLVRIWLDGFPSKPFRW